MYTGILYLLLPQLPVISKLLAYILEKSIILMNKSLAVIEHAPYAGINKIWLTTTEYILLYVIIISLFYFLYDRKKWLLKLCALCLLLLSISISFKHLNMVRSNSITFLNLRKHTGIVLKNGNETLVLCDLQDSDKNYQYAVQPYLDSCMGKITLCDINRNMQNAFAIKKGGLIQFFNKRILIYDKQLQNRPLPYKLKTDYLYITGSPDIDLNSINKNYSYGMLVIDGNNTDNLITQIINQAKNRHIIYKVLKRNNSLILVSN